MGAPANHAEALIKVCSEIVSELARAHEANETINLNALRAKVAKKHRLNGSPRLVDIIAAVPEGLKAALLPKLKAKPIRTASGVSVHSGGDQRSRGEPIVLRFTLAHLMNAFGLFSPPHRLPS